MSDSKRTADGKALEPRRGAGDSNKKANAAGGATGGGTGGGSATGVTPLLLSRLHAIFQRVQGAEIGGELDMEKRAEHLRTATKEAHVISRTASALPPTQRAMVLELADNVKAVVGSLRDMSEEEVKRSVEVWNRRQAAKASAAAAAPAAVTASDEGAAVADAEAEAAAAAERPPPPTTPEERVQHAVRRCQSWLTLFAADEFVAATIAARKRTIALASADVNAMMAELEALEAATNLDEMLDAIDKATDAIVAAKTDTVRIEKLKLPRELEDGAAAAAGTAGTDAGAEEDNTVSLSALNEVLADFHDALNAEHIMEVDAQLRATTVAAIISRLGEIQEKVLPTVGGSDDVKQQAASAVEMLLKRARRIQDADSA